MDPNNTINILLAILGGLGVGGILVKFYENFSTQKINRQEKKEKQYKCLLENGVGFLQGKGFDDDQKRNRFMNELYSNALIYSSDEVLLKAIEFIKSLDPQDNTVKNTRDECYKDLIIAVRKEIYGKKAHISRDQIIFKKIN